MRNKHEVEIDLDDDNDKELVEVHMDRQTLNKLLAMQGEEDRDSDGKHRFDKLRSIADMPDFLSRLINMFTNNIHDMEDDAEDDEEYDDDEDEDEEEGEEDYHNEPIEVNIEDIRKHGNKSDTEVAMLPHKLIEIFDSITGSDNINKKTGKKEYFNLSGALKGLSGSMSRASMPKMPSLSSLFGRGNAAPSPRSGYVNLNSNPNPQFNMGNMYPSMPQQIFGRPLANAANAANFAYNTMGQAANSAYNTMQPMMNRAYNSMGNAASSAYRGTGNAMSSLGNMFSNMPRNVNNYFNGNAQERQPLLPRQAQQLPVQAQQQQMPQQGYFERALTPVFTDAGSNLGQMIGGGLGGLAGATIVPRISGALGGMLAGPIGGTLGHYGSIIPGTYLAQKAGNYLGGKLGARGGRALARTIGGGIDRGVNAIDPYLVAARDNIDRGADRAAQYMAPLAPAASMLGNVLSTLGNYDPAQMLARFAVNNAPQADVYNDDYNYSPRSRSDSDASFTTARNYDLDDYMNQLDLDIDY